jgi:hypothetical protein
VPDPFAGEIANSGRFAVSRTGNLSGPLTVTVEFSGTATYGTDYTTTGTSPVVLGRATVTLGAGISSVFVWVFPINDTAVEPAETIILTLIAGDDYDLGASTTGTVTIAAR